MRNYLFSKARKILLSGKIESDGIGKTVEYFKVLSPSGETYHPYIEYGESGILKYSCDCRWSSVRGIVHNSPCSHLIAVIAWKVGIVGKE